ncbi:VOC family protein [Microbacterium terregens]|uniref:VOC family protein n=1 Tax=Microbacterium terregens TaxID=69363 RepID=UPI003CD06948
MGRAHEGATDRGRSHGRGSQPSRSGRGPGRPRTTAVLPPCRWSEVRTQPAPPRRSDRERRTAHARTVGHAERDRLIALGAAVLRLVDQTWGAWPELYYQLQDPEGNEFCLQ